MLYDSTYMSYLKYTNLQKQHIGYWLSGTGGSEGKRRCSVLLGENVLEVCCTTSMCIFNTTVLHFLKWLRL